jgi:hypothetical protein
MYYRYQFIQNELSKPYHASGRKSFYSFQHEALYITGTVYNKDVAIQTFVVADDGVATFTSIGDPEVKVNYGFYSTGTNKFGFCWNSNNHDSHVVCSYEYDYGGGK